ncbi:alkaline phosphatase family protein [Luteitalea sp. TBR-22]|uniref:alkaline phosphatase family protein n=1 Tax=Luteitalea sp. TBR-22 TaxID=2802971 RepID=UPI001AFCAEB7|nr:nucleotide pyrophosphatase/phosphodiesterase family protein [Luteitalea sp. TBR-22]BCS35496.1 alkaline phosphatase family protein [Luteitalea sp. TBR-22]
MRAVLALLLAATLSAWAAPSSPRRHLVVVVDGLRPDYVTPELMPHLVALGARGVVFTRHHAVYPSVTRVNASSFSTGAYPEGHGLLGNSVFFPRVDSARFLDTADRDALLRIEAAEGRLLTAPTLGEVLQGVGKRMLVVGSGSAGAAWLNNHTVAGGAMLHAEFVVPASLRPAVEALGPLPGKAAPAHERDRYAVDAFLKVGVPRVDPTVTVLWLGALDATAHAKGVGTAETREVLRHVDAQIARLQEGLAAAGLLDAYDIWVTSDHGFSTHTGGPDIAALLRPFAGTLPDGSPRVVHSGGAIHVRDADPVVIAGIVAALQRTPGVGAIFTKSPKAGALDGHVAGTLSFEAIRWQHDRSAQILFSPDWTDEPNAAGMRGTVAAGGTAGHGSASPWDIHNTLIAAGPDIRKGARIDLPSANVDLAPTMLRLLGLSAPSTMQGRVLAEGLAGQPMPAGDAARSHEHTARTPSGDYAVTAQFSSVRVGGREYRYFDGARVTRR